MKAKILRYLREAHKRVTIGSVETKKPSAWFGEIYTEFAKLFSEGEGHDVPGRFEILGVLVRSEIPFRISGDYAEDYQTFFFNPTEGDNLLMHRLTSRKFALVEVEIDRRQMQLFDREEQAQ